MTALLLLLCVTGDAFAWGEKDGRAELRHVEASGIVRMVGNSPMNSLVISGEDREWHIESKETKKLMEFQQQTVTVKAQEYYHDLVFANGSSAGRQYYLKNIVIMKPKQQK
ncbi:MAG: hypothetical protein FWC24_02450 [Treponema sp.]|nr:hypothetical protein [Treponema sp.]